MEVRRRFSVPVPGREVRSQMPVKPAREPGRCDAFVDESESACSFSLRRRLSLEAAECGLPPGAAMPSVTV